MQTNNKFINWLKRFDFSFILAMIAIFIIGILNLYSATHAHHLGFMRELYKTQLMWFSVSVVVALIFSLITPKNLFRLSYFFYLGNIFLLILVLVLGKKGMGAQRWLALGPFRIQPSELMKISAAMVLARYFAVNRPEKILELKNLIIPGILVLIPTALVIMQPDLGTGLLIVLISTVIIFYKRLSTRSIVVLGIVGMVSGVLMYNFGLKEYQKKRILTFLNPQADARGSGYNVLQSQIAIGSGKLIGKGYKNSSQASLNFLPENHTDFVFSIFNEEHGLIGSLILIALYMVLIFRFIWLAGSVNNLYDSILTIGIMAIFFWHTFINMAMVMGLLPVVGLPLPFMSYGGSSLLTFGTCIGMATSMSNSRNLF